MRELKQTPLYPMIEKYGGRAIDFGGWALPVQFSSIKEEHEAVRKHAGLFDVSHMGEFLLRGEGSEQFLQSILTNNVSKLRVGRAQYHIMCYPDGGTVDDLIIYRKTENEFLIVVNASNIEKDFQWMMQHKPENLELTNVSEQFAQVALQGPKAEEILQNLTATPLSEIGFFAFADQQVVGEVEALIARTGYTGEDGFELYCKPEEAIQLWEALIEAGAIPCGLGARDTLRFEAGLPLYGQELSQTITPVEAGMGFAVRIDKEEDFIGKTILKEQKENGAPRKLVGIEMVDRGIPRHGYPVFIGEKQIGTITTGTQSPTLGINIGLALLESESSPIGTEVTVEIRGKQLKAKIVATPFYKRNRS